MASYLWGKSGKFWHALARHDPEFIYDTPRESAKLTAVARKKDPNAPAVLIPIVKDTKPGTATTHCGLAGLKLERLGVDPKKGDPLCPACEVKTKSG